MIWRLCPPWLPNAMRCVATLYTPSRIWVRSAKTKVDPGCHTGNQPFIVMIILSTYALAFRFADLRRRMNPYPHQAIALSFSAGHRGGRGGRLVSKIIMKR